MVSIIASATDYYVSSSGNDAADGKSSSTPWQSIAKVNSVFSGLNPGDRILFKRGEQFYGAIQISRSGASGSPITIGAYGTGSNPVISGFTTISGWTSYGGGIYYKNITCQSSPNVVTVNDVNTPIGRWPNTGFLTIDSHVSNTSITDSELPGSPDWTGAEVVIRKLPYIYDRNTITDHSGSTLYYKSGSGCSADDGYGYFIQNDIKTLDKEGEWYYDGSAFFMYFGSGNPDSYTVKVSTTDQLAYLNSKNYIIFDGIGFEGANSYAIQINNSDYITVQNCSINFTGRSAIYGPWNGTSPYCKIINTTINNSNNNGIELYGDHTNATVQGNTVSNTGLIMGMGESGDGTYEGILVYGDNSLIQNNVVENSGYVGINFSGNNTIVNNNFVNNFNLVKNDGGGIYTYVGTGTAHTGEKVTNNIVLNGAGYRPGVPDNTVEAHGIYMDDRTRNVVLTGNTVAHCSSSGFYLHNAHEIEVSGNTAYDNGSGIDDYGCQLLFIHDGYSPDDPIRNISINNNIFFARTSSENIISFCTSSNDIPSFGTSDNNCYARPVNNSYIARTWTAGWYSTANNYSLSGWQSYTGKDRNSYISPITVSDISKIIFEYNASGSAKVVTLDGSYIDVKGTKYSGTITLQPYTSAVLMVDPNPSAPPASPVYVSASVENAAPSVIVMNYSLSLANIVPAASAFTIQVNSVARSVSSVSVSGTMVLLTLSSPVGNGNAVTVAYTTPSSNPLQTPAGGKAASITAQTVTNRVNPPQVPVFVGAAVENAAPSVIEMTYDLELAGIVPSVQSFTVTVNSLARGVSTVSITGVKVLVTISSPVVYGDAVTITYTKPSSNPLQCPAGGQCAALNAQLVTNHVNAVNQPPATVNTAPVVVVNYPQKAEAGFVAELNATGSYDANKDNLTFSWKTPDNISVTATNNPVLRFLAPIVESSRTYEFYLTVSDGKTTESKSVPVEVVPFHPELQAAKIESIEASDYQSPYIPENVTDGNIGTMWSANGTEQWILFELEESFCIHHIKISFQPGQKKESYFDVYGSVDKVNWEPVLIKSASCAFSGDLQVFEFPSSKTTREFNYIKLVGQGNSTDTWNNISEFRIFGFRHRNSPEYEQLAVKLYPNPAREQVNVSIDDQTFIPDYIRVISLSGKILMDNKIEPDIRQFQVPLDLKPGVYIIQMGTGNITMFTQKLVISY
ncbi:MAG: SwmB domain-containing protein [Bacteroidota bacterium]|nr:SwmB domain-containing protein [Bacteroidota bacterium]